MCGIVGYVNTEAKYSKARRDWIEHALYVDQLRGKDSTGLYIRPKKQFAADKEYPTATYYKRAMSAADFLRLQPVQTMLNKVDDAVVAIGHNRAATQGAKWDDDNAHPFVMKSISMVHNGTLITRRGLSKYHEVDSYSIAHELANTAVSDYIDVLKELDGAYTLVWDNRQTNKVYIARNSQRPLWGCYGYEHKTLFFASEPWMIDELMWRTKTQDVLDRSKKGALKMLDFDVNTLFEVDYTGAEISMKHTEYTPTPVVTKPPVNFYPTNTTKAGGGSGGTNINKPVNLTNNEVKGCPYKKGDILYASKWQWDVDKGKSRGTIRGYSSVHPDVVFSCGNVTSKMNDILTKAWTEWVEAALTSGEDLDMEILLSGEVTSISKPKGKDSCYVVNLKSSTLKVEGFDSESYDDDEEEDATEKKSKALVSVDNGQTYKYGTLYVSSGEWLEAVKNGCDICGGTLLLSDHAQVEWLETIINGNERVIDPLCSDCWASMCGDKHGHIQ
jgi:hypothetical protein